MPIPPRVNLDAESRALIYQGASVNQLAAIFRIKSDVVMRRLGDLQPIGTGRQGNPIFDLAEAAGKLVPPTITEEMIDRYMRSVNHMNLPPAVSKLYWDALRVREKYREEANELWRTEDIVRVLAETFQSIRMSLILLPDALRDEGNLNDGQFRIVQSSIDETVEDLRVRLIADLRKPRDTIRSPSDEEDGSL